MDRNSLSADRMGWSRYPDFLPSEFECSHTGDVCMNEDFMERLQALRSEFGKPMRITSGYRGASHPVEARKNEPGAHNYGRACDVAVSGGDALRLVALAVKHGFTGVGVNQRGDGRFIHLDDMPSSAIRPRPWVWSY